MRSPPPASEEVSSRQDFVLTSGRKRSKAALDAEQAPEPILLDQLAQQQKSLSHLRF